MDFLAWINQHSILATLLGIVLSVVCLFIVAHLIEWYYNKKRCLEMVFLRILVPKKEGKQEKEDEGEQFGSSKDFTKQIGIMTQCLESLSTLSSERLWYRYIAGQDFYSFEIVATSGVINFYVVIPYHQKSTFQKILTSFYPSAVIEEVEEYNLFKPGTHAYGRYLSLKKSYAYPIKTYLHTNTEPMNALLNAMSKLSPDDSAAIQMVVRPREDGWQKKCKSLIQELYQNKSSGGILSWFKPLTWMRTIVNIFAVGTGQNLSQDKAGDRTDPQTEDLVKAIGEKSSHAGWDTVIRVVASSKNPNESREIVEIIRNAFGQFNSAEGNAFEKILYFSYKRLLVNFIYRSMWRHV